MFSSILKKTGILSGAVLLAWSVAAHSSTAHGQKVVVTVRPYETLWTIAQAHYGGDPRDAIYRIQTANHLAGTTIRPGERLVLP